jgi:hypothetical protein
MTNQWDRSQTNDESESGLSNTLPGHRAGSPSLLTLMGPIPKSAAGFKDSINILGWIVGQGQVRIDPTKMKGLSEWPRELKMVHDIRQILGLLGYQRPFIRGFAEIARPLTNLTKKDVMFEWTQECKDALDKLIAAVTCGPMLWHPDPTRQYELYTDASSFAVGAVLLQRDDQNKPRVVGYHSNLLNSAE